MNQVYLKPMSREMYHAFFMEYKNDPDLCLHQDDCVPYVYQHEAVEQYIQRQIDKGRLPFAIMLGDEIIGEVKIYDILPGESASLGIALKNDACKNHGYGTRAEQLAIEYVFHSLDIPVLYADAVITNTRSQHVLEKAGFTLLREDADRRHYVCRRND